MPRTALLCISLLTTLAGWVGAEPEQRAPQRLELRLERVALFKNGLAFAVRGSPMPQTPGSYLLGGLPPAAHGTFWLTGPTGAEIQGVFARPGRVEAPASTVAELLEANLGRRAKLTFGQNRGTPVPLEGKLLFVREPEESSTGPNASYYARQLRVLIVENEQGVSAVPLESVTSATFLDPPRLPQRPSRPCGHHAFHQSGLTPG